MKRTTNQPVPDRRPRADVDWKKVVLMESDVDLDVDDAFETS